MGKDFKEKEFIKKGFNTIATRYNFFNNLVSLGTHKRIKNKLAKTVINHIPEKGRILDICCGTGDIAFCLEKYVKQNQEIIGLDFSRKMLQIAKKRESRVHFFLKDVLPLPYNNNSVLAVTVGYGLRNLTDLNFGLQEIYRVLQKGGVFCSLDMDKPTNPIIRRLFYLFFFYLVPKIGALLVKNSDMFSYFPESTKTYPDAQAMSKKLKKIGFQQVSYQNFLLGACVSHFAKK